MEKLLETIEVQQSQFFLDSTRPESVMKVNSRCMTKGYYNLILSIRDLGLYQKGIKPHKYWSINEVKKYFGIKGNKTAIYDQLLQLQDEYKEAV